MNGPWSRARKEALRRATDEMDAQNAWNYEARIKQILTQLKITHFDQSVDQLSGGQIKRIALPMPVICRAVC